jgi:hypothetical protein
VLAYLSPDLLAIGGLGLKTDGIIGTEFEHGAVAFFDHGLIESREKDHQTRLDIGFWSGATLGDGKIRPIG